jgi:parvulin-like peptidyl-prolyl isomerase
VAVAYFNCRIDDYQRNKILKRLFVLLLAVSCLLAPIHAFAQTKTAVTLATVGDTSISSDAFQTRFTYERYVMSAQIKQLVDLYKSYSFTSDQIAQQLSSQTPYSTWISELQIPELLGQHVIDDMIDDQLIKQEASHMNIVVNDVDVDHELKRFFGVTGDLDHLSADDQTKYEADLKQYLSDLKQATGLTEVDIRPYYEAKAFRDAITDSLTKGVSQVLYAHLRHILVATEADAKDILKQLHAGKDFAALAKQYSTDTTTSENGG